MFNPKAGKSKGTGKIYEIHSPSLDLYYYGSTFHRLSLRKALHLSNYKRKQQGAERKNITAFNVLAGEDCIFKIIEEYKKISKPDLLNKENECINKMREIRGGRVVNKNSNLTKDIKKYQALYREHNRDYFDEWRNNHKDYFKNYYQNNRQELSDKRKEKYAEYKRKEIIAKLNTNFYDKTPLKKIDKYNIRFNHSKRIYE